ncbi:MAG: flippase-like domain-containing protein [Gemmatimonadetes bacterium]|nr:flippase-like domain-containing protein [Gemmatimonadota bacterium]MYF74498.1 flippase-like domain-containing protein [Gemmatimonadota bacterium]MYK50612.1 flippase-like domain-containing protein [Gemmatimonadota bacterium]
MKTFLKLAASLALMGGFLWAAFRNVEWGRLEEALQTANPLWLLLSAIIIIASGLPRAWRWRILLSPVAPNISIRSTFWAVMVAYAGNVVFPRAGEVARALALERDHPTGISAILATVIVERLLDILTLLIIFGVVLFFAREQIGAVFPELEPVALLILPIILFAFVFLGLLSAREERGLSIFHRLLARLSPRLADGATHILRSFLQGMRAIHTVEGYAGILVSTLILNSLYLFAMYLPFYSFDLSHNYNLGLFEAMVVMTIATIGFVLPAPGGIGSYHFFCAQTLHHFYHVPIEIALAFATSVHAVAILGFLLFGGPPLINLLWHKKAKKQVL